MRSFKKLFLAGAILVMLPAVAPAQEVIKEVSGPRLEGILKSLNLQYIKGDFKGTPYFDYTHKNVTLRLWNFNGKDLMIDIVLPKVEWEVINNWNGSTKFTRARLAKDNTVLESNLDVTGGVTEETIKQFLRTFDQELANWGNQTTAAVVEEEIFKTVTTEQLERILTGLNIQYEKKQGKGNNNYYYDFERKGLRIRLTSFGGADLMIDCTYPEAPLAKLNQWNSNRSYVRAVLYPGNGKPYTALESNLDCVGGTSESVIRYFITTFDEEAAAFDRHLKGVK